ncbi:hypothetical protein VE02_01727 [Pseudogymnoascus sp. 03VT05]|nr:hypothetical protein VE02_01727 [Pseudogymnoascus sp. 03VT05]
MEPKRSSLFFAFIKCGSPSQGVLETRGEYSDILTDMLQSVAPTLPEWGETDITGLTFDATRGHLPGPGTIDEFDAVVVTGSGCLASESTPWIVKLRSFLAGLYHNKPKIRLIGSCFGHQILCRALFQASEEDFPLQTRRAVVSRNEKGWELGVHPIKLSAAFMERFGPVISNPTSHSEMRLRLIHQDEVNPLSLPADFINVGSSDLCGTQGVYKRGRVFTLQGHPEFDTNIMVEFGKPILGKKTMDEVKGGPDDYLYAAQAILEFLQEEALKQEVTEEAADGKEAVGHGEVAEEVAEQGEVTRDDVIENISVLFEKLTVCGHSSVLGSC